MKISSRNLHGIVILLLTFAALLTVTESHPPEEHSLRPHARTGGHTADYRAMPGGAALSSFTGDRKNGNVNLVWVTTRERNARTFELQRASSMSRGWEVLSEIPAVGNSSIEQHYLYTDRAAPPEDLRYMLRIRSQDGSVQYSRIISVPAGSLLRTFVIEGPTDRYGKMFRTTVALHDSARIALILTDGIGQTLVRVLPPRIVSRGTHSFPIDCTSLPGGSYALHLHTPEGKYSRAIHLR